MENPQVNWYIPFIKTNDFMTTGKALLGVMAGLAAGAVLGLLFAPQRGNVIRRNIRRRGEDAIEEIRDTIEDRLDELTDTVRSTIRRSKKNEFRKTAEGVS